ncbi:MAG: nuclear transport factor 2 family protein [Pseudoxanthomonas sp.]
MPRFRCLPALGMVLVLALLAGCRHEPPEQALRKTIATMQSAAEAGDTDALFAPIADDFSGSEAMDRQAFRRYVTVLRLRNAKVSVTLGPIDVKLFGDRASADFTAALSGGAGLLPERARVYWVSTGWRLEGSEWKLISARWDNGP